MTDAERLARAVAVLDGIRQAFRSDDGAQLPPGYTISGPLHSNFMGTEGWDAYHDEGRRRVARQVSSDNDEARRRVRRQLVINCWYDLADHVLEDEAARRRHAAITADGTGTHG